MALLGVEMHDDGPRRILHLAERRLDGRFVVPVRDVEIVEAHGLEIVAGVGAVRLAQARQRFVESAMGFGDGHLVVVEDDDQVRPLLRGIVQPLERLAARKRTVADDGHDVELFAAQIARLGEPRRKRDARGGMTDDEMVVGRLARFRIPRHVVVVGGIDVRPHAPGQHLVRIALVRDVEDDFVRRRIEDAVQSDGRLDEAEIGPDMPGMARGAQDKRLAHGVAEVVHFVRRDGFHVGGTLDGHQVKHGCFPFLCGLVPLWFSV